MHLEVLAEDANGLSERRILYQCDQIMFRGALGNSVAQVVPLVVLKHQTQSRHGLKLWM